MKREKAGLLDLRSNRIVNVANCLLQAPKLLIPIEKEGKQMVPTILAIRCNNNF